MGKKTRKDPRPFLKRMLKIISNPEHPLHFLVNKGPDGKYEWNTVTYTTKSGKTKTGRFPMSWNPDHSGRPTIQVGHASSYSGGAVQVLTIEDADFNKLTGEIIESRGVYSRKAYVIIEGVPVDLKSANQWVKDGFPLTQGDIINGKIVDPPDIGNAVRSTISRSISNSTIDNRMNRPVNRTVEAGKTPTPANDYAVTFVSSKNRNYKWKLNPKIKAKIKGGAFFLFEIGLGLLSAWVENKRIRRMMKNLQPIINKNISEIMKSQLAINLFNKFRTGGEKDMGYQFYFEIVVKPKRTFSDGGPTFSGSISGIEFQYIYLKKEKGLDFFPEGDAHRDHFKYGRFYIEVFENGYVIDDGAWDAANAIFSKLKILAKRKTRLAYSDKLYISSFTRYATLFPQSAASKILSSLIPVLENKSIIEASNQKINLTTAFQEGIGNNEPYSFENPPPLFYAEKYYAGTRELYRVEYDNFYQWASKKRGEKHSEKLVLNIVTNGRELVGDEGSRLFWRKILELHPQRWIK